ncbi:1,4-dihydroxy-2-naphthoate polyprenyltransferase [Marinobacter sp.]|uniref:1,4-dihydroxy-2-naphthoate polyprenyltransferase n=1 Tax=Marinobacter sp. TaxID=50741 RepID=UPI002B46B842|nr:1,4-dihydroxy-2-naphthoate polyprenyltransferase [Marinobacter sp.]HKK55594.1 1,4-dihydroxy-2-naphthoate polyprenyltransferase [Marinobacter sp.]
MSNLHAWFLALRPKTLPASVAPILLGSALAFSEGYFNTTAFCLALICAFFLQLAVNFANDLFDAQKGVDTKKRLGPLRGLHLGLIQSDQLKKGLWLVLGIALVSGFLLAAMVSWWLLVFGLASLIVALVYSGGPYPLASYALGELLVLVFFGWLAVMGSYFIHTHNLTLESFVYATLVGLLSAAIMLVNNLRDCYTDATAGKKTLVVYLGERKSRALYRLLLLAAPLLHWSQNPRMDDWAWLPLLLIAPLLFLLFRRIGHLEGKELNRMLALTSLTLLIYSLSQSLLLLLVG